MRKFIISVLIAMLALVLVACNNGGDSGGDTGGDSGGSTNLSQTFNLADGSSLSYPEGWVANEDSGAAVFASEQSILDMFTSGEQPESINAGQALVLVAVQPAADLGGMSLSDLISPMAATFGEDAAPTELEVGGKEAVSLSGQANDNGVASGGYILLVNDTDNGAILMLTSITAPGEQDSLGATVQAIAESYKPAGE